jgi:hypothetical protein
MSQVLDDFKRAALIPDWPTAMRSCNGLSMYEMLRGLDSLPRNVLDDMRAQLVFYAGMYGVDRINYAMDVVKDRRLPQVAPGDLDSTGQVQDAKNFLASAGSAHAGSQKRLKVALFWTRNAQVESISPGLVQKAQGVLHGNGNQLTLHVLRVRTILATDKDLSESDPESCASSEFTEVQALAEHSQVYTPDRLPVIFYTSLRTLDSHGSAHDPISHGCGYQSSPNKGFAMINTRAVAADLVTLLHELGPWRRPAPRFFRRLQFHELRPEPHQDQSDPVDQADHGILLCLTEEFPFSRRLRLMPAC